MNVNAATAVSYTSISNGTILLGELRDHFNAKDLFMGNAQYDEANLFEYLEKFDIYTRFYGHNKTIRGK